jgi:hypothetical protein
VCSDGAVCAPRRSAGQLLIAVEMRGQPNVQLRPVTGTLIHPMPCAHPAVGRGPVRSGRYRPLAGCPTAPGVAYPCGPRPETGDRAPGPYTLRKYGAGGGDLAQPRLGLGSIRAAICSRTASPQRGWGGGSGHRYGLPERRRRVRRATRSWGRVRGGYRPGSSIVSDRVLPSHRR